MVTLMDLKLKHEVRNSCDRPESRNTGLRLVDANLSRPYVKREGERKKALEVTILLAMSPAGGIPEMLDC
jgi:hypothetical protein